MKKEIDFSRGVRGKYVGKRIRIVGDKSVRKSPNPVMTERELLQRKIAELEALVAKYEAEHARILELSGAEQLAEAS
ncbi:MAG: hypothetical protein ACREEM_51615 [Blastocatellia bacterium]